MWGRSQFPRWLPRKNLSLETDVPQVLSFCIARMLPSFQVKHTDKLIWGNWSVTMLQNDLFPLLFSPAELAGAAESSHLEAPPTSVGPIKPNSIHVLSPALDDASKDDVIFFWSTPRRSASLPTRVSEGSALPQLHKSEGRAARISPRNDSKWGYCYGASCYNLGSAYIVPWTRTLF